MLQFLAMANLDSIIKELQQERDRLDVAIESKVHGLYYLTHANNREV